MQGPPPSDQIRYKDLKAGLFAYPLVALSFIFFANDNSLPTLIRLPTFFSDLLFAVLVTYAVGFYLAWLTRALDKKLPWHKAFRIRLIRQFLWGVFVPLTVSMLLEIIYLSVIEIPLHSSSILNLELPLAFIFLMIVNLLYLVNYLAQQKKVKPVTEKDSMVSWPQFIMVQKGSAEHRLDIGQCAAIITMDKLLWVYTFGGEQYRLHATLEEWEKKLNPGDFYRLNRQYLVAFMAIVSVEQTATRKLKINLAIPTDEIYVSKSNATHFKLWWKKGQGR